MLHLSEHPNIALDKPDMSVSPLDPGRAVSSGEFRIADSDRVADVERKQALLAEFLADRKVDAVLLQDPANFAWFTSGAVCPRTANGSPAAALFILPQSRVVIANNVDSGELFDKELTGLGFLLKERPWHEPRERLLEDLVRGRKVISDHPAPEATVESDTFREMRSILQSVEQQRIAKLAADVAHVVEATCRTLSQGETEAEAVGQIAHRMWKREIEPVSIQVISDGRGKHYRHWRSSSDGISKWAVISAEGMRHGLHVGCTRTVVFGTVPEPVEKAYKALMQVHAAAMLLTDPGLTIDAIWMKVRRIYEKAGAADEWELCDQGGITGFRSIECPLKAGNMSFLSARSAVHWRPGIGPARMGDCILVGSDSNRLLTVPTDWPTQHVSVRGTAVSVPSVLVRD
jgi:Xaa-Pro aminopeptidase